MKQLLFLLLLIGLKVNGQAPYDSTKNRQIVQAYGQDLGNYSFKSLVMPRDTIKMAVKDSGALGYKNGEFYKFNGYEWSKIVTISVGPGPSSGWGTGGNYSPSIPTPYKIGFLDSFDFKIITNGLTRINVPAEGVRRDTGQATVKVVLIDTTTGKLFYTDMATGGGGTGTWGSISGILNDQTDLQAALDSKVNVGDTAALNANNLIGGTISWPSTIFSTPTIGTISGRIITYSPSLANQSTNTFFGRIASGGGPPSFSAFSSLDSTNNSIWHSEGWLNSRYAVMSGSNTQVLFNNSGQIGADAGLAWDNSGKGLTISGNGGLSINRASSQPFVRFLVASSQVAQIRAAANTMNFTDGGGTNTWMSLSNTGLGIGSAITPGVFALNVSGSNTNLTAQLNRPSLASTNTIQQTLAIKSTTGANMVDGYGASVLFRIQDNAAVSNDIAEVKALRDGADNSGAIQLSVYNAGVVNDAVTISSNGNMGIGAVAGASAALHVISTTKGVVFSPMSTSQRNSIPSPGTGLMVYDTDLKRYVTYDGSAWHYSPKTFIGTAAPATSPEATGDTFTDTTNKKMYVATGTASSADWTILN